MLHSICQQIRKTQQWPQFSFQSLRKAVTKNVQATAQLHSSHTLAKWYSKLSKPGFNSTWTANFQMFKLDWEKAEEPEIKLPISVGLLKKREFQKNIYFCFIDYAKAFDCVDPNKLWLTGLLIAAIMGIIAITTTAPVAEIALYQMVQTTTSVQECLKNACSAWGAQSHIDEEINNRLVDLENAVLLLGEVQNLKSQIH